MEISNPIQPTQKKLNSRLETYKKPPITAAAKTLFPKNDSVEISGETEKKRLELIKKRINSGFYSSSLVKKDLSEKLSKVLDQIFN
jgi:hypothetical protein